MPMCIWPGKNYFTENPSNVLPWAPYTCPMFLYIEQLKKCPVVLFI